MKRFLSFATYGFVMLLLVLFALFFRQSFVVMLLVIMMVLPFASYHMTKHALGQLTIRMATPCTQTRKGETLPLSIVLESRSLFPLLDIHFTFQLASAYYHSAKPLSIVIGTGKFGSHALSVPVTYEHLGLFTASAYDFYTWDYLHFFRFDIAAKQSCEVAVLPPKCERMTVHEALYAEGFDEYETSEKRGNASSDVTDIREYIPGDRLQAIHWKLTAKTDKLMVKEFESTSSHQFVVLLDLYKNPDNPLSLDAAITNAYQISMTLIMMNELFLFGFYNDALSDFCFYPITHEDQLTEALINAYYAPAYDTPSLGFDTYIGSDLKKGSLLHACEKGVFDDFSQQIC